MAMLRVRGIGVAVSVRTSTSVRRALSFSLSRTPKRCSSSITTKPKSLKRDLSLQQPLRGDDYVDLARGDAGENALRLLVASKARQAFDAHRPIGEPVDEGRVVLLREQGGRHQHRDLLAGLHGDESGAQRDLGLAEADIAADDPIHGLVGLQVAQDLFDRGGLIGGLLEREAGLECAIFRFAGQHRRALPRRAARIQVQQFRGDIADALCGLAARLLPLLAAELVKRRGFRRRARVAGHEVQRLHRNIQLVAVGVFEHQKFAGVPGDVHGLQSDVAADAVGSRAPPERRCAGPTAP